MSFWSEIFASILALSALVKLNFLIIYSAVEYEGNIDAFKIIDNGSFFSAEIIKIYRIVLYKLSEIECHMAHLAEIPDIRLHIRD